jgi:DNA ligase (NAD+)
MKIQIPTNCPCCDSLLEKVNEQLFCRNTGCSAQLNKKIEHFAKVLGIKGLGAKSIEKINLSDITELFYLDRDTLVEALSSEKVADKLLDEISRAKEADLATVLASFSIPLFGNTAANKLVSVVNSIEEISAETCKQAGLGEKVTSNLLDWLATEYLELKEFLPFTFKSQTKSSSTEAKAVICITGKLKSFKTKAEATKALEALGYKVSDSLTKTTNYLVDEEDKGSSKRKKAEEYGTNIINNLLEFIGK